MLPDNPQGRADYIRAREQRNLHRELILDGNHGDMETLKARELEVMAMEAEMSGLREQMDFLVSIGGLTQEQTDALGHAIGWGEAFLQTLQGVAR